MISVGVLLGMLKCVQGTVPLLSPTIDWQAISYPDVVSDFPSDELAHSIDRDLVGNATHPAFYTQFSDNATSGNISDDEVGFRFRMAGDQPPPSFSGQVWIGADLDHDGSLDIFIGANKNTISIHDAGANLNTSPSTTSIESTPFWSTDALNDVNFSWTEITPTLAPDTTDFDIDGASDTDYFLTFVFPYEQMLNAISALTPVVAFDLNSPIAYVAATASQGQVLNSDLNGVDGGVNSSTAWTDLGAISPKITVSGAPVLEPGMTALILGLSGLAYVSRKCRRGLKK